MAKMNATEIEKVEYVKGYSLELTEEELYALLAVLYRVGGHPQESARGIVDGIISAMRVGGSVNGMRSRYDYDNVEGGIVFHGHAHEAK